MCINISDIIERSLFSAGTIKLPVKQWLALIKPSHTLLLVKCIFFIFFSSKPDKRNSLLLLIERITQTESDNCYEKHWTVSITSHFMNKSRVSLEHWNVGHLCIAFSAQCKCDSSGVERWVKVSWFLFRLNVQSEIK